MGVIKLKKLVIFAVLAFTGFGLSLYVKPVSAKKPADDCSYVTDGTIPYSTGHYLEGENLMPGYDIFGYNYQAHIFNGSFANAYLGRPGSGLPPYTGDDDTYLAEHPAASSNWTWPFRNVQLQMKWNDAWLANKDCNDDKTLDRATPYRGSGAWLTNHAKGTYESSTEYNWDVSGDWVIAVNGGAYNHDYTFNMTSLPDGTFTGTGGYPAGAASYTYDEIVINGQVTGNTVAFTAAYYVNGLPTGYSWDATGNIDSSGHFVNGTGTSGVVNWYSTSGEATKVYATCEVDDFVKIVAAPTDAYHDSSVPGYYDEGMYYEYNGGPEIGPAIWGSFAVIQEKSYDPCGEYQVTNYMSQGRKGLGNWQD